MTSISVAFLTPYASPTSMTLGYVKTIKALASALAHPSDLIPNVKIEGSEFVSLEEGVSLVAPSDVIKTRSRLARQFREKTKADVALWLDDDVEVPSLTAVANAIAFAVKYDAVVGVPYPRKGLNQQAMVHAIRWAIAASEKSSYDNPEEGRIAADILANPLKYAFTQGDFAWLSCALQPKPPPHVWLSPLDGIGFGCVATTRKVLDRVTERYDAPWPQGVAFDDQRLPGKTVGIFYPVFEGMMLPSEDYGFCARARACGFPVYAYVGPGAPARHIGAITFEAAPQTMLLRGEGWPLR